MKNLSFDANLKTVIWRILIGLCVSAFPLCAQTSTFRPGTTDPAGNPRNLTLFRDEQIFAIGLPSSQNTPVRAATVSFDGSLNPTSNVTVPFWTLNVARGQFNVQGAKGRIMHPDHDDIFLVSRWGYDPGSTQLIGTFSDDQSGYYFTITPNLSNRLPAYTDSLSVAAGDLDNLYDSTGNYHDEVVVAWTEPQADGCPSGPAPVPHLGVLNFNGKDPYNPTLTSISVAASGSPLYNYCALNGYGFANIPTIVPQPNDTILATTIGDFDGDGKNEIALAYLIPGGNNSPAIRVAIYRYLNDGANASLTLLNSYDLSIPSTFQANSGMVGTVTLAAGNFDGSGVDQLVVGTAAYWGSLVNGGFASGTLVTQPVAFLVTGGQTQDTITGASSSGQNNASTDFTVSLSSGKYVPRTVTLSGATGSWAAINGTWPVTPSPTGFTLDIDSSAFGPFAGQNVSVTTAAPLAQADFLPLPSIPGTNNGSIAVDKADASARIRVQALPGLFHYDPNNGFDYRRRQIAMAWNARPSGSQDADTHLALLQITKDDKIQIASYQNNLIGDWQVYQTLSMGAGALRGDNDTNDPTWSIYFGGFGNATVSGSFYWGAVNSVWKVAPESGDPTKLQLTNICTGKAAGDNSPDNTGIPSPYCNVWAPDVNTVFSPSPGANANYLRTPVIAADLNGNSLKLGAPMHAQLFNPAKSDYILEQPPQHSAWLDTAGNGKPTVVTISRYPNSFYTSMQDSNSIQLNTTDKDHLDWNVGGSVAVSASSTMKEGIGEDLGGSQTTGISAKVTYDRNQQSDNYGSGYDSQTVTLGSNTGTDDSLVLEGQLFDIWRYRLYGSGTDTGNPNAPNSFYEIVLPGPSIRATMGGLDTDWYQPLHEPGNVLSYPDSNTACNPSDIGAITLPTNPPTTKVTPLISCQEIFYNGNTTKVGLSLDHQNTNGSTTDFTNQLHADLDLNYTAKASAVAGGFGAKAQFSADVDIHGGADWGHLHTSDGTTSSASGITIYSAQGDSQHAYPYFPILYHTVAGGLKVAFGVGDLGQSSAGGSFWTDFYGQKPDPALNLPNRFIATYNANGAVNGWAPETTILRKKMKGFALRSAALNPLTNEYPLLGRNPGEGETVLLDVRVYNYSIAVTDPNNPKPNVTAPFEVKIYTIPYDPATDNEICPGIPATGAGGRVCPASARTFVGNASTQVSGGVQTFQLGARQHADAYYLWNIQNMGPASGTGANSYRVYVVLDSGNDPSVEANPAEPPCTQMPCEDPAGNENIIDAGQNNEGWELMSVGPLNPTAVGGGRKDAESTVTQAELSAATPGTNASVSTPAAMSPADGVRQKRDSKKNKKLLAYLHQPLRIRVTAISNSDSRLWEHAVIYDLGPRLPSPTPEALSKSPAVAGKVVRGTRPQGSSIWTTWTPRKKGLHHLYVMIQTPTGARPAGDLFVWVRRAPCDLNDDGRVDRHDLNMLSRDLGKTTEASACGESCDLDGDGKITMKDLDLMSQACDSADCSFRSMEYVGGASAEEPDMREVREAEAATLAASTSDNPETAQFLAAPDSQPKESELFKAELARKQGLRSIQYYYKGKPVTSGPFAKQIAPIAKR